MATATDSYWIASRPSPVFPALTRDAEADVAVIGAGIVGLVAATLLVEAGRSVVVVDAREPVSGTTGYTTAKLTSAHGAIYDHLVSTFGLDGARAYAAANEAGIDWIEQRVVRDGIDCGFERLPHVIYTDDPARSDSLRREAGAAVSAGLAAGFDTDAGLPFPVAAAVTVQNQAQFHPRAFLLALAERLRDSVHSHTTATGLSDGDPCTVETREATITARDVVVATQMPVFDRGLFFTKAHPYHSYAVAGPIDAGRAPAAMYISEGGSTRSIRTIPSPEGPLLLVGGNGHHTGSASGSGRYDELAGFAREHWGVAETPYRWSARDFVSVDKVPFVGTLTRGSKHVYTATGFGKWGLAAGVAAAMTIRDAICGGAAPWASLFDAHRLHPAQARSFVTENVKVGGHFVGGRLPGGKDPEELSPGEGTVVTRGLKKIAVHRDDDGRLHACSATCTHLGCVVAWNAADRTWDCPCHGSRFGARGEVLAGPARDPLGPAEV